MLSQGCQDQETHFITWFNACIVTADLTSSVSFPNPPAPVPSASPSSPCTKRSLYWPTILSVEDNSCDGDGCCALNVSKTCGVIYSKQIFDQH